MLKIGNKEFKTKKITAKFPVDFYRETGIDIFTIEQMQEQPILVYDALLNLAYRLIDGFEGTLDDFAEEVTYLDVMGSAEDIMGVFSNASAAKSKSADKSKKQQ